MLGLILPSPYPLLGVIHPLVFLITVLVLEEAEVGQELYLQHQLLRVEQEGYLYLDKVIVADSLLTILLLEWVLYQVGVEVQVVLQHLIPHQALHVEADVVDLDIYGLLQALLTVEVEGAEAVLLQPLLG